LGQTKSAIQCSQCGEELNPDGESSTRSPCLVCGGMSRIYSLKTHGEIKSYGHVKPSLAHYEDELLNLGEYFFQQELFEMAIIVIHMACEFATERAFFVAWRELGLEKVGENVFPFMNGFNLNNDKIRNLFNALYNDTIQENHFWQNFQRSAILRNGIMHGRKKAKKTDAENSLQAGKACVQYLMSRSDAFGTGK